MSSPFVEVFSAAAAELIVKLQTIELQSDLLLTKEKLEPQLRHRLKSVHDNSTRAVTLCRLIFGCLGQLHEANVDFRSESTHLPNKEGKSAMTTKLPLAGKSETIGP